MPRYRDGSDTRGRIAARVRGDTDDETRRETIVRANQSSGSAGVVDAAGLLRVWGGREHWGGGDDLSLLDIIKEMNMSLGVIPSR